MLPNKINISIAIIWKLKSSKKTVLSKVELTVDSVNISKHSKCATVIFWQPNKPNKVEYHNKFYINKSKKALDS